MFRPIKTPGDTRADAPAATPTNPPSLASTLTFQVVTLDDKVCTLTAHHGDTVAMALLKAGVLPFRRTALSGQARAPLCLMGVCFDCLLGVDGRANVQACMVEVSGGMVVKLLDGARPLELGTVQPPGSAGTA